MITNKHKIRYFLQSLVKSVLRQREECPSCGHVRADQVDKKYGVTRLLRCQKCKLMFRAPTTSDEQFKRYYQSAYKEGFTTELPSPEELESLTSSKFENTDKNYMKYIKVLDALGCEHGDRLLDYGCSWGYGSWQFGKAGYSVKAFELSKKRGEFAKHQLGVDVLSNFINADQQYDIFFSAHVIEHIPKVSELISLARKVVRPGGWFVAFTPNWSFDYRKVNPKGWHNMWGFVHPIAPDEVFYGHLFQDLKYVIDSYPYGLSDISKWALKENGEKILRLDGGELLIAVKF